MIFTIMDLRAYSRAKEIYDTTEPAKRPNSSLMDKVSQITMELAKEKIAEIEAERNGR